MKKYLLLGILIILSTTVFAENDMEITSSFYTPNDIDAELYFNAGGDVNLNINGDSVDNHFTSIVSSSRRSDESMYNLLGDVFMKKNQKENYNYIPLDLTKGMYNLRNSVTNYIMTVVTNYYQPQIDEMNFRLEVLESQYTESEICLMRMALAKQKGLDEVSCGNETVYIQNGVLFTLSNI